MRQQQCRTKTKEEMLEQVAEDVEKASNADYSESLAGLEEEFSELITYALNHKHEIILMTVRMEQGFSSYEAYKKDIDRSSTDLMDLMVRKNGLYNFRLAYILDTGMILVFGSSVIVSFFPRADGKYDVRAVPSLEKAVEEGLLKSTNSVMEATPNYIGIVSYTAIKNAKKIQMMAAYACDSTQCTSLDLLPNW